MENLRKEWITLVKGRGVWPKWYIIHVFHLLCTIFLYSCKKIVILSFIIVKMWRLHNKAQGEIVLSVSSSNHTMHCISE